MGESSKVQSRSGFSMLRDESGNVSSVRVMAAALILIGLVAFITGIFMSGLGNKDGAAFCTTAMQWSFGVAAGNLGFGQLKSAVTNYANRPAQSANFKPGE